MEEEIVFLNGELETLQINAASVWRVAIDAVRVDLTRDTSGETSLWQVRIVLKDPAQLKTFSVNVATIEGCLTDLHRQIKTAALDNLASARERVTELLWAEV